MLIKTSSETKTPERAASCTHAYLFTLFSPRNYTWDELENVTIQTKIRVRLHGNTQAVLRPIYKECPRATTPCTVTSHSKCRTGHRSYRIETESGYEIEKITSVNVPCPPREPSRYAILKDEPVAILMLRLQQPWSFKGRHPTVPPWKVRADPRFKVVRAIEGAPMPQCLISQSRCYYIVAPVTVTLHPRDKMLMHSGLRLLFSRGYHGVLHGSLLAGGSKVIDGDYTRQLYIPLENVHKTPRTIFAGDRIATLEVCKTALIPEDTGEALPARCGGFGSTGV